VFINIFNVRTILGNPKFILNWVGSHSSILKCKSLSRGIIPVSSNLSYRRIYFTSIDRYDFVVISNTIVPAIPLFARAIELEEEDAEELLDEAAFGLGLLLKLLLLELLPLELLLL
jgi:hypothetical protein